MKKKIITLLPVALGLVALLMVVATVWVMLSKSDVPTDIPTTEPTAAPTTQPTAAPTETEPESKFDAEACQDIIGQWKFTVVLDGGLMNVPELEGSASFDITYTFDDTGAYTVAAETDVMTTSVSGYEALLVPYMVDTRHTIFTSEGRIAGMSAGQIEAAWEETGKAENQEKADAFITGLDLEKRYTDLFRTGDYYVEDGRLYLSLSKDVYDSVAFTLEDGKLLLSDWETTAYERVGLAFPLTLETAAQ